MKRVPPGILTALMLALPISLPSLADTPTPPTQPCSDGTTSAATANGACSGHGGLQKASPGTTGAMTKAAADTAEPPVKLTPSAATGTVPPAGATAQCKDGSYSKSKSHSRACSKRGGVSNWLTAGN
jgi:hypothetical protein